MTNLQEPDPIVARYSPSPSRRNGTSRTKFIAEESSSLGPSPSSSSSSSSPSGRLTMPIVRTTELATATNHISANNGHSFEVTVKLQIPAALADHPVAFTVQITPVKPAEAH